MVQTPLKPMTLEAFLTLPETKPASEYFDGKIIQKPMPQGEHSSIQVELAPAINAVLKSQKVASAFTELRCTFDGSSIVPDIVVFVWARIPRQDNGRIANAFTTAPDWIIEILSPGQSHTKVAKKILRCLDQGSVMGWLIDPAEDAVLVYSKEQGASVYDLTDNAPETTLPVPDFAQGFELTIGELFGWLMG